MDEYKLTSFYPHKGPSKYAYTTDFGSERNRDKTASAAKANTAYSTIATQAGNKFKILYNLKVLINGARKAELAFLSATGIDITSEKIAKEIFVNFNLILNSQKLFERNLDMFQAISEGYEGKLIDPTKFFHSYLNQAINKYAVAKNFNINQASGKQLEKLLDTIMFEALEKTYLKCQEVIDKQGNRRILEGGDTKKRGEKSSQSFKEMVEVIRKLRNTGIFGKYSSLFNLEDTLRSLADNQGFIVKKPNYTLYSTDQGGTALELITSVIAPEFARIHLTNYSPSGTVTISGEQTGGKAYNQQKGDTVIAYATSSVDLSQMQPYFSKQTDKSDRVKNIKALQEYLSTVGNQIEHILFISDKNYTIRANWGGASAQEKMSLENARAMLGLFGVPGINGLIDYLANCGPDMIQGDDANAQVRTTLASYIAYFLFDHVEITGTESGPNVVNIINLSGTYIPLSVYLEGVYQSLEKRLLNLNTTANYLVKVELEFGGIEPSHEWTVGTWESFREGREQKSYIAYHIMMDIADFITELMS